MTDPKLPPTPESEELRQRFRDSIAEDLKQMSLIATAAPHLSKAGLRWAISLLEARLGREP